MGSYKNRSGTQAPRSDKSTTCFLVKDSVPHSADRANIALRLHVVPSPSLIFNFIETLPTSSATCSAGFGKTIVVAGIRPPWSSERGC